MQLLLLPVCAIIVLTSLFPPEEVCNQYRTRPEHNDSLLMEKHKLEIKRDWVMESELLSDEQVDSAFKENNASITDARLVYSPDSTFKVFCFQITGCGAHCSESWDAWIHYNLKEEEMVSKAGFNTVDDIFKLENNRYLLIESWSNREVYVYPCMTARMLSFFSNAAAPPYIEYSEVTVVSFCDTRMNAATDFHSMSFNREKLILDFHYGISFTDDWDDNTRKYTVDADTLYSGQYRYDSGRFVMQKMDHYVFDRNLPIKDTLQK
ncbi:MAG: hypothetical protein KKD31_03500 [Bacteroidetes bacterium]|nr:hypothetical protein [Bacteroidota bacterium]